MNLRRAWELSEGRAEREFHRTENARLSFHEEINFYVDGKQVLIVPSSEKYSVRLKKAIEYLSKGSYENDPILRRQPRVLGDVGALRAVSYLSRTTGLSKFIVGETFVRSSLVPRLRARFDLLDMEGRTYAEVKMSHRGIEVKDEPLRRQLALVSERGGEYWFLAWGRLPRTRLDFLKRLADKYKRTGVSFRIVVNGEEVR